MQRAHRHLRQNGGVALAIEVESGLYWRQEAGRQEICRKAQVTPLEFLRVAACSKRHHVGLAQLFQRVHEPPSVRAIEDVCCGRTQLGMNSRKLQRIVLIRVLAVKEQITLLTQGRYARSIVVHVVEDDAVLRHLTRGGHHGSETLDGGVHASTAVLGPEQATVLCVRVEQVIFDKFLLRFWNDVNPTRPPLPFVGKCARPANARKSIVPRLRTQNDDGL
mmetsp:Transcript_32469/g.87170  ORF Transcript_32469/g.87170 Transcript_32469/m.87170 type:complete len:220 (-) Transcript_32469:206-865(-)